MSSTGPALTRQTGVPWSTAHLSGSGGGWSTPGRWRPWTTDALEELILECIDQAARRYRTRSGCGAGFFRIQREWLLETLCEWFGLERQRTRAFAVIGREQPVTLLLDGLELAFRIDRIDPLRGRLPGADRLQDRRRPVRG